MVGYEVEKRFLRRRVVGKPRGPLLRTIREVEGKGHRAPRRDWGVTRRRDEQDERSE
jgi:hypothetical protein